MVPVRDGTGWSGGVWCGPRRARAAADPVSGWCSVRTRLDCARAVRVASPDPQRDRAGAAAGLEADRDLVRLVAVLVMRTLQACDARLVDAQERRAWPAARPT